MNIMCIYRSSCFSPNMEENDRAIMNAVADRLHSSGHDVCRIQEDDLSDIGSRTPDKVYTMGRLDKTLDVLQQFEVQGVTVVNPTMGIRHCERKLFTQILMDEDVPFPESKISLVSDNISWELFPCWLKKGEGYASVAEDVMFIRNDKELQDGMALMKHRRIQTVVVSQHLEGDLIKCYGVKDSQFFYWYYAAEGHSKFGFEAINGKRHGYTFSKKQLKAICNYAASVVGIDVYGADCVVSKDGKIRIIDINDWPSFSHCKEQAAEMIAKR